MKTHNTSLAWNSDTPLALLKSMAGEISRSETNLRAIFDNTDIGLLLLDADYNVIASNSITTCWSQNMFSAVLVKGINVREVILLERQAEFDITITRIKNGEHLNYQSHFPNAEKDLRWFEINGQPVLESDGKVIGICFSINNVTKRKESELEIKDLNENLEQRVLERTAELTEANKALEAFSYSVSHDLRAPLRAILSFTKLIQREYGDRMQPRVKELFDFIVSYAKRMYNIVEDLLKLAKNGKAKLVLAPVNMTALVQEIWLSILRETPNHVTLELKELGEAYVDISMMKQVLINLLSNAIKYSSKTARPAITIWSEQANGLSVFYFRDNGIGFDMADHNRLFGAFQRLHSTNDFEGTGVGLTLVKRIIEKHGGTVGAEAKPGEGATFHFTLPNHLPA